MSEKEKEKGRYCKKFLIHSLVTAVLHLCWEGPEKLIIEFPPSQFSLKTKTFFFLLTVEKAKVTVVVVATIAATTEPAEHQNQKNSQQQKKKQRN